MSKDNLDAETSKAVSESQALDAMFSGSGWSIAERELTETINELRDARNLQSDLSPEETVLEMKINLGVADNLEAWVDDLKGRVENAIIMAGNDVKSKLIERR